MYLFDQDSVPFDVSTIVVDTNHVSVLIFIAVEDQFLAH